MTDAKAARRKAAEREALVDRLCSCVECGTIRRALLFDGTYTLWGVVPTDREALIAVVGLDWELRQGYGWAGMHEFHCPPGRAQYPFVEVIESDQAEA